MYNRMATFITKKMLRYSIIDEDKFDIYLYGFEILIAYLIYFICLLVVAIVTNSILESILFCFGFMVIRKYEGGYHASTYLKCQILFITNQLMFIVILKVIPQHTYYYLGVLIVLFLILTTWLCAPIDNENKKFNESEYKFFKKTSKICSLVIASLSLFMLSLPHISTFLIAFLIGVLSASISVVIGYFKQLILNNKISKEVTK